MNHFLIIDSLSPVLQASHPGDNIIAPFFNKKIEVRKDEFSAVCESGSLFIIPEIDKANTGIKDFEEYFQHSVELQVYYVHENKSEAILYCQLNDIAAFEGKSEKDGLPF